MKISHAFITGTLALAVLASCNNNSSKDGSDSTSTSSSSLFGGMSDESANEIITFNNDMVKVENTHNTFIRNFMNAVDRVEKVIQTKLADPSAIAIAPSFIPSVTIHKASSLKVPSNLKGDYKVWIDSLSTSFENLKNIQKEIEVYKSAEDWKEDKGAKFEEYKKQAMAEINKNRNASEAIFKALQPEAEKAEEQILKDHPLKDQIISSRRIMDYAQKITEGTYEITDFTAYKGVFEKQYKELEALYNKNKENPITDEQYKSDNTSYVHFNDSVNEFLAKMRVIQRDLNETGKISESNFTNLDNAMQSIVSQYNSFVN